MAVAAARPRAQEPPAAGLPPRSPRSSPADTNCSAGRCRAPLRIPIGPSGMLRCGKHRGVAGLRGNGAGIPKAGWHRPHRSPRSPTEPPPRLLPGGARPGSTAAERGVTEPTARPEGRGAQRWRGGRGRPSRAPRSPGRGPAAPPAQPPPQAGAQRTAREHRPPPPPPRAAAERACAVRAPPGPTPGRLETAGSRESAAERVLAAAAILGERGSRDRSQPFASAFPSPPPPPPAGNRARTAGPGPRRRPGAGPARGTSRFEDGGCGGCFGGGGGLAGSPRGCSGEERGAARQFMSGTRVGGEGGEARNRDPPAASRGARPPGEALRGSPQLPGGRWRGRTPRRQSQPQSPATLN
ncbi:translation initiation factor IF-2-like [Apus apus]|uniref:translation initiation factor IF-2-like n=1 Tax=Apus apus TaxID=8895 RepID=UPI0021F8EE33|nr:translation initiation factor IF-2-like [Apus apus]